MKEQKSKTIELFATYEETIQQRITKLENDGFVKINTTYFGGGSKYDYCIVFKKQLEPEIDKLTTPDWYKINNIWHQCQIISNDDGLSLWVDGKFQERVREVLLKHFKLNGINIKENLLKWTFNSNETEFKQPKVKIHNLINETNRQKISNKTIIRLQHKDTGEIIEGNRIQLINALNTTKGTLSKLINNKLKSIKGFKLIE